MSGTKWMIVAWVAVLGGVAGCGRTAPRPAPIEICTDQRDNDGDGLVDCDDDDCLGDPACAPGPCQPEIDFGTLAPHDSSATRLVDTRGAFDDQVTGCGPPGGGDVVGRFRLSGGADVELSWDQRSDHVFGLFAALPDEGCDEQRLACVDPDGQATGEQTFARLARGVYYLVVEAHAQATEGPLTITLSTGSSQLIEQCDNGADDDGDGLVDCEDLDCVDHPACPGPL